MVRKNHGLRLFTVVMMVIAMFVGTLAPCCETAKAASYTVSFEGRGGKVKSGVQHAGEYRFVTSPSANPYTIPEYFFEKTGYDQIGWTMNSSNTTRVDYYAGAKVTRSSNITLYPIYKAKQYTVTCWKGKYASNGPMNVSFKVNYGTNLLSGVNLPKPAAGYYRTWCLLGTDTAVNSYTIVTSGMDI